MYLQARARRPHRGLLAPLVLGAALGFLVLQPGVASAGTVHALWHMDESSGSTMVDSSGNGNQGTLHHVTRVSPGFGGEGHAYKFNGTSAYVQVPNDATLNPGSSDLTISLYLKTSNLPKKGDYDLVRKGEFTGQEYKIELLQSGAVTCVFRGSNNHGNATGGSGLKDGSWHHVVCIKTSTSLRLVIDGKVIQTTKRKVGSIRNGKPLFIGAHPDLDFYQGRLDEISLTVG